MTRPSSMKVYRSTPLSAVASVVVFALVAVLAIMPLVMSADVTGPLTTLFIYIILGVMWNVLAGYGGLVSVGQQAFFGLGAYAAIRLSYGGVPVYPALILGALLAGVTALPLSVFALRLKGGEFAIGMWIVAELTHLLVNIDSLIQGETGTSLIALNALPPAARQRDIYWLALASMVLLGASVFAILRGPLGASVRAIRDNEEAAASVGVNVLGCKRIIFALSAVGCAMAGTLWLATYITFQPKSYFSAQWSAYMIFMALVGGLGTFEGPILGAILFFLMEVLFGDTGVWYLASLGLMAVILSLLLPQGLWGFIENRFSLHLLPVGYRLLPTKKPSDVKLSEVPQKSFSH
jgi:branched-chain amino acid transport system permease protein